MFKKMCDVWLFGWFISGIGMVLYYVNYDWCVVIFDYDDIYIVLKLICGYIFSGEWCC